MSDLDLDELTRRTRRLRASREKKGGRPPREERIIAGFEEIQRFVETAWPRAAARRGSRHLRAALCRAPRPPARAGRVPRPCLCRSIIRGLLGGSSDYASAAPSETIDDDELLAELEGAAGAADITELAPCPHQRREARGRGDRQSRKVRGLRQVQAAVRAGAEGPRKRRPQTRRFVKDAGFLKAEIRQGSFSSSAVRCLCRRGGEPFKAPNGESDARLRVIYRQRDRKQFADALASARALQGRGGGASPNRSPDRCLRTKTRTAICQRHDLCAAKQVRPSDVAANRDVLHKIGVTSGSVERRIANARLDPTFLMADVEIVATYELYNINRTKLENLIHRVFAPPASTSKSRIASASRSSRANGSSCRFSSSTRPSERSRTARSPGTSMIRRRPN